MSVKSTANGMVSSKTAFVTEEERTQKPNLPSHIPAKYIIKLFESAGP
jgi:hypothetical protein